VLRLYAPDICIFTETKLTKKMETPTYTKVFLTIHRRIGGVLHAVKDNKIEYHSFQASRKNYGLYTICSIKKVRIHHIGIYHLCQGSLPNEEHRDCLLGGIYYVSVYLGQKKRRLRSTCRKFQSKAREIHQTRRKIGPVSCPS